MGALGVLDGADKMSAAAQFDSMNVTAFVYAPCGTFRESEAYPVGLFGYEAGDATNGINGDSAGTQNEIDIRVSERLDDERRRAFEEGRQRGTEEGRMAERQAHAKFLTDFERKRMEQTALTLKAFEEEREHYLHTVEHEVVRLALSVAARILRREAQMDPLLLTGAVRVALGQLPSATQVSIRVPAQEAELWSETISHIANIAVEPNVIADSSMHLGDAVLESQLGCVDLSLGVQLREIERGFFDSAGCSNILRAGLPTEPIRAEASESDQ